MRTTSPEIAVIGGGIIGLSIAWQCQRNGYQVQLFEKDLPEHSTSWVAAGMLAPASELLPEKREAYEERRSSLDQYPRFLEELREDAGHAPRIWKAGSLWMELERHDPSVLENKLALWEHIGVPYRELPLQKAVERSGVAPSYGVRRAFELPEEAHINNRTLLKDLLQGFLLKGGELHERTPVHEVEREEEGWRLNTPRGDVRSDELILSAGVESQGIEGLPSNRNRLFPVKGAIIELRGAPRPAPILRSPGCYLLAKGPRTLLLGATMEESADRTVYAGNIRELLQEGEWLFPPLKDFVWHRVSVGHRPAYPDHRSRVQREEGSGLIRATGHFRHGILGAPLTAYRVLGLLEGRRELC